MTCRILIPCKPLDEGKSRLSDILTGPARRELCSQLLSNTLRLAKSIARAVDIFVVTRDLFAMDAAHSACVGVIHDGAGTLNGALSHGRDRLLADTQSLVILPIDLVCANEISIRRTLDIADVAIAGDRTNAGTNLLTLTGHAARQFDFQFGKNSFRRHIESSQKRGFTVQTIRDERLQFDLDEPGDYFTAERAGYLRETVSV